MNLYAAAGRSLLAITTCLFALSVSPEVEAQRAKGLLTLPLNPPLPPVRPKESGPEKSAPSPGVRAAEPKQQEQARAAEPGACLGLLRERGVDFTPLDRKEDSGVCAVEEPVSFKGVRLEGGRLISLDSPVTLRCSFAADIALWIRDDLAPAMTRHGLTLRGLSGVGGQACRNRNRQSAGPVSEHATGNAFDLRRLVIEGAPPIDIMGDRADKTRALREDIRSGACARFPTVLGSNSDAFHEDHLHVDGRTRRGGFRLCQWSVQ